VENPTTYKKYYSIDDIATMLGFSYNKVNKLVKNNEIPAYKIGNQYRVERQDFTEYLKNSKVTKKEKKTSKQVYVKRPMLENKHGITLVGI